MVHKEYSVEHQSLNSNAFMRLLLPPMISLLWGCFVVISTITIMILYRELALPEVRFLMNYGHKLIKLSI